MTAAQLRNVTVKHDIHPESTVCVDDGELVRIVTGYRTHRDGRNRLVLILETREPDVESVGLPDTETGDFDGTGAEGVAARRIEG
jgi:hypothetical protein